MIQGRPWHTELFLIWRLGKALEESARAPEPAKPVPRELRERIEADMVNVADLCEGLKNVFGSSADYLPEKICRHLSRMKWKAWNEPPDFVNTDEEIVKYYREYIPALRRMADMVLESAKVHGVGDCGGKTLPIGDVLKVVGIPKEPENGMEMGA